MIKECTRAPWRDGLCVIHYDESMFLKSRQVYEPDEMMRALKLYIPEEYLDGDLPYSNMLVEGVKRLLRDYETLEEIKLKLK